MPDCRDPEHLHPNGMSQGSDESCSEKGSVAGISDESALAAGEDPDLPAPPKGALSSRPSVEQETPERTFHRALARARNLLRCANTIEDTSCQKDIFRAAIVMSIAALDGHIRSVFLARLESTKGTSSTSLRDWLKRTASKDTLISIACSTSPHKKFLQHIETSFELRSFQGAKNIRDAMRLLGKSDILEEIARNLNKNTSLLVGDLEKYTKRRHEIAHRSDFNLKHNPPAERDISREFAEMCVSFVQEFGDALSEVL